jgi:hypothetical protein
MRHLPWLIALLAVIATAHAEPPRPAKPYTPVPIVRPKAFDDASFVAFRNELAAAAKARVYAGLATLVRKRNFFWGRDFGQRFDPRKPAVDNLAVAVELEHADGTGWSKLAAFASEPAIEPLDSRPGVVCAPARPNYDGVAYAKLLDKTYTNAEEWAYPRADATPVRNAPGPTAATIGMLAPIFVWLLATDGAYEPGDSSWARVGLPDGKSGFVAPGSLRTLTAEQLCYVKDPIDGWRIAGYVGRGN